MVQNVEIYAYFLFPFLKTFAKSLSRKKLVFKYSYDGDFLP